MKKNKIVFWSATSLVSIMMLYSAYAYISQPEISQGFAHLGYPDYFRIELAFAKMAGAILLLVPVGSRIKEWTYAGFTIVFVSAVIAHLSSGDPFSAVVGPIVFLSLLMVSYFTFHRLSKTRVSIVGSIPAKQSKMNRA